MIFIEALRSGWQAILANRLRSILTTLGIMIGVAAVIILAALKIRQEAEPWPQGQASVDSEPSPDDERDRRSARSDADVRMQLDDDAIERMIRSRDLHDRTIKDTEISDAQEIQ